MKADVKTLYKLAILLCLLGAALLALHLVPIQQEQAPQTTEQTYMIDLPVSQILGIAIENEFGVITMLSTPEGMEVSGGAGAVPFSEEVFKSIYYGLCHLPATELPQGTEIDTGSPLATVLYLDQSGATMEYIMSSSRGPDGEFYMLDIQSGLVYLLDAMTGERFLIGTDDLQSLALLPTISAENLSSIESFSLTDHNSPQRSYSISSDVSGDLILYSFTSPINLRVDWNSVWDRIFVPISKVYGEGIVGDVQSIETPDYTLNISIDGQEYTLLIALEEDGAFVDSSLQEQVLSISPDSLMFLSENYEDFLGDDIFQVTPSFLDSIVLSTPTASYTVRIQQAEDGTSLVVGEDGEPLSQEAIDTICGIPVNTRLDENLVATSQPQLSVSYHYKNGVTDRLEFLDLSDGTQVAVRYNDMVFYSTFTTVLNDLTAIITQ